MDHELPTDEAFRSFVKEKLNSAGAALLGEFDGSAVTHCFWGSGEKAASIRRSHVVTLESRDAENAFSETAVVDHWRWFGSENVLIKHMEEWCRARLPSTSELPGWRFDIEAASAGCQPAFSLARRAPAREGSFEKWILQFDAAIADTLMPATLSIDIANVVLFAEDTDGESAMKRRLLECRHEALKALPKDTLSTPPPFFDRPQKAGFANADRWREFLASMQSALVYFRGALRSHGSGSGVVEPSGSFYVVADRRADFGHADRPAPAKCCIAIASIVPAGCKTRRKYAKLAKLLMTLRHAMSALSSSIPTLNQWLTGDDRERELAIVVSVKAAFGAHPPIPRWIELLSKWMLGLTKELRGRVHEGRKLGFWMVMADKGQISESEIFQTRALARSSLDRVSIPWTGTESQPGIVDPNAVVTAANAVADENHAWFRDGKSALFWDSTMASSAPFGLVRVRNGSWAQWTSTDWDSIPHECPRLSLFYVNPDGHGGLIHAGDGPARRTFSIAPDRDWEAAEMGNLRERLLNQFARSLTTPNGIQHIRAARTLSDVTANMAADPSEGAIFVILDATTGHKLRQMSQVWQLKGTSESGTAVSALCSSEIRSLANADGAVTLIADENDVRMRSGVLLSQDGVDRAVIDQLVAECADLLRGSGSRRWNAVMSIAVPEILGSIVVSQDGDVICLEKKREGDVVTVAVELFSRNASISTVSFRLKATS